MYKKNSNDDYERLIIQERMREASDTSLVYPSIGNHRPYQHGGSGTKTATSDDPKTKSIPEKPQEAATCSDSISSATTLFDFDGYKADIDHKEGWHRLHAARCAEYGVNIPWYNFLEMEGHQLGDPMYANQQQDRSARSRTRRLMTHRRRTETSPEFLTLVKKINPNLFAPPALAACDSDTSLSPSAVDDIRSIDGIEYYLAAGCVTQMFWFALGYYLYNRCFSKRENPRPKLRRFVEEIGGQQ